MRPSSFELTARGGWTRCKTQRVTFRSGCCSWSCYRSLTPGERDALSYLDRAPQRGGVFSDYYLGMAVPAFTGRRTWLGEWTWTPHFARRQALAEAVTQARMPAQAARALVARTGARFA